MAEEQELYVKAEKPSRWTFKNYFKAIKRFKWWVIGFTLLGTILGYVSFEFILNPFRGSLSATYNYSLPGTIDEQEVYHLPDGTLFSPYDIVSYESLKDTASLDKDYKLVNIDKIYKNNAVSVTSVTESLENGATKVVGYKVSARVKDFPNAVIGKKYLYDLINYPIRISKNSLDRFVIDLEESEGLSYNQEISLLSSSFATIKSTYNYLKSTFGETSIVDSKQLRDFISEFELISSDGFSSIVDRLYGLLYSEFFVKYEVGHETEKINEINALCKSYVEIILDKQKSYERNLFSLNKLNESASINNADTDFLKQVTSYTNTLNTLQKEIDALEKQLSFYGWELKDGSYAPNYKLGVLQKLTEKNADWVQSNIKFSKDVEAVTETIKSQCEVVTNIFKSLHTSYKQKATLTESGYIVLSKQISSFIGLALGLILGFGCSSLICAAIYIDKEEK